jgi:hypothetical protein
MSIVDLADFTSYVGSEIAANQVDLEASLNAAELAVQYHCHRAFAAPATSATARVFTIRSGAVLEVDEFTDITGLIVDNDGTIIAAIDYQLEPSDGLVYGFAAPYRQIRLLNSTSWADEVTVTAKWGWVPAGVYEATRVLGKDLAGLRDTRFGVAGWGDFGVVRMRENPQVIALLAPYVRWDRAGVA